MSQAVANSTSLAHLVTIGQFRLLRETFDQVRIPPAVWRDLVERSHDGRSPRAIREAAAEGWLHVVAPADETLVSSLERDLPDSDAETIALAVQEKPDAVLLDRASIISLLIQAEQQTRASVLQGHLARLRPAAGARSDARRGRDALAAVGEHEN